MARYLAIAIGMLALSSLCLDSAISQQGKGKKGGNNKSDAVVGAIWHFTAVNESTNETKTFRVRVKNGVLYSREGDEVGSVRSIKANVVEGAESELKWGAKLPLQGSFRITMNKVGHWAGVLTTADEQKWKVRADVKDR